MQIYIFRHAEKNASLRDDPPLSVRGLAQAEQLVRCLIPRTESSWLFLSSPKQRARQTLQPLAEHWAQQPRLSAELDERQNEESAETFYARVNAQIRWLGTTAFQTAPGLVLITHSDWIHEALTAIPCETDLQNESYQWWPPGQFMHFRVQNGIWRLEDFSHF